MDESKAVKFDDDIESERTFVKDTDHVMIDVTREGVDSDDYLRGFLLHHRMSTLGPGIAVAGVV